MSSLILDRDGAKVFTTSVMMLAALILMESDAPVVEVQHIPARPGMNGPRLQVTFGDCEGVRQVWGSFHGDIKPPRAITLSRLRQVDSLASVLRYYAKNKVLPTWTQPLQKDHMRHVTHLCK